jgi:hypothetical protein
MTIDEERIWLRVKVPAEDGTAVMEMTDPVVPENGPASLRSWVLAALEQRADGATKAAGRMVAALRERSWEGDDVLADQLEAWLGGGVVRDLRPLPLDLDEPADILDFARYSPQRQRLIGYGRCVREPGARPNAIPEIANRGVSARPRRRDGRVGGAAS